MDWHPLVIHFPLALWPAALALDLIAWLARRPAWHPPALLLQAAAAAGALAAVLTGNAAAVVRRASALAPAMERHEDWATLALFCLLAATLGRLGLHLRGQPGGRSMAVWSLVAGAATALLWIAAHYGGLLVHGAVLP